MTQLNPASFKDYKAFILAVETEVRAFQRGFRTRLAEAIGCQSAFVTQVLKGSQHFSLEQGFKVAGYFELSDLKRKYFLTSLELARAGTPELRRYFTQELDQLRGQLLDLQRNVASAQELSDDRKAVYYSHWVYSAIHILVTIPGFQGVDQISMALGLREADVQAALQFLAGAGLVQSEKGFLKPGHTQLHLTRESPFIRDHHTQWRLRALEKISRNPTTDVHYSTVSSLSRRDFDQLKAKMVEWIKTYTETVRDSKEEELVSFTMDFYRLTDAT